MVEHSQVDRRQKSLSRRDFLRKAVVVGGAAAAAPYITPRSAIAGLLQPSEAPKNVPELRESIEREFNVKLSTFRENMAEVGRPPRNPRFFQDYPEGWTIEQLNQLREFLRALPTHMYEPKDKRKLRITLAGGQNVKGRYSFSASGYEEDIEEYLRLEGNDPNWVPHVDINMSLQPPERSFEALVHELTHHTMPIRIQITDPSHITSDNSIQSPLFDRLEDAVGEKYNSEFREKYNTLLIQRNQELFREHSKRLGREATIDDLNEEDKQLAHFFRDFSYGLSTTNPLEFIPMMAQKYVYGPETFTRLYGQLFSEGVVEKLLEFNRETIFGEMYTPRVPV